MVTFQDEVASDKSQQRKSRDSVYLESQIKQEEEGSTLSVLPNKELGELQKQQNRNAEISASQCKEEGKTDSTITGEALENMQQRQSSDSTRDQSSQSNQEGNPLSVIPERVSHNLQERQSTDSDSGDHTSEVNQKIPLKMSDNKLQRRRSDIEVRASQYNQEIRGLSAKPEKVPHSLQLTQSPRTGSQMVQRDQEGRTPSRIPDKALEDGYNWRKYGQKLVKGNEFIRSYYRCTHSSCLAKRQVERSQEGTITDTVYLGKHEHPKPQPSPRIAVGFQLPIPLKQPEAKRPGEPSLATRVDKASSAHDLTSHHAEPSESPQGLPAIAPTDDAMEGVISHSNRTRDAVDHSCYLDSKRQKRDSCNVEETLVEKPIGEPRVVVQTMSEVDVLNDGYRWRKYGQKMVKGNPNPRSYYRCSNAGCPVKKHVERASHDPKMVITTYGGQHDHEMPPARTVTPNTAGANSSTTALNGESRSRPEESSAVCLDVVVYTSAKTELK